jgi:predicted transcriptional regulator
MTRAERRRLAQILICEGVEPAVLDFREVTSEGSFESWHAVLGELRAEDQSFLETVEAQRQVMVLKALVASERPMGLAELSAGRGMTMPPLRSLLKALVTDGFLVASGEEHGAMAVRYECAEAINPHDLGEAALRLWRLATCGAIPTPVEPPPPPPEAMPAGPWFHEAFNTIEHLRAQLAAHSGEINGQAAVVHHALTSMWQMLKADGFALDRAHQAIQKRYAAQVSTTMEKLTRYRELVEACLDPTHRLRLQQQEDEARAVARQIPPAHRRHTVSFRRH